MSHDQPHPDDERVSRLLADARHTAPLPPEVAARLDRTLEGLVGERRTPAAPVAPVIDLAARRRRRRLTTGLVAAAAVVALGVSLPQIDLGSSSDSEASSGAAGEPAAGDSVPDSESRELASSGEDSGGGSPSAEAAEPAAPMASPAEVRPETFKKDATAARDQADQVTDDAQATPCGGLPADAEQVVPVRYADREGYLVFGATEGDRQPVTLYLCPGGELAREAMVPAP